MVRATGEGVTHPNIVILGFQQSSLNSLTPSLFLSLFVLLSARRGSPAARKLVRGLSLYTGRSLSPLTVVVRLRKPYANTSQSSIKIPFAKYGSKKAARRPREELPLTNIGGPEPRRRWLRLSQLLKI